ncbi:hypothetical protein PYCC9005_005572 [Savitreella phatthalungensis]
MCSRQDEGAKDDNDSVDGQQHEKRKVKLGYIRQSVACSYCRIRKIRCIVAQDSRDGRCENCIRLGKHCVYVRVGENHPLEALNRPQAGSRSRRLDARPMQDMWYAGMSIGSAPVTPLLPPAGLAGGFPVAVAGYRETTNPRPGLPHRHTAPFAMSDPLQPGALPLWNTSVDDSGLTYALPTTRSRSLDQQMLETGDAGQYASSSMACDMRHTHGVNSLYPFTVQTASSTTTTTSDEYESEFVFDLPADTSTSPSPLITGGTTPNDWTSVPAAAELAAAVAMQQTSSYGEQLISRQTSRPRERPVPYAVGYQSGNSRMRAAHAARFVLPHHEQHRNEQDPHDSSRQ